MIDNRSLLDWYYKTPNPPNKENQMLNLSQLLRHYGFDYPMTKEQEVLFKLRYML